MAEQIDLRDKIIFTLRTEEMVTNHTVKIIATIDAAITRQTDDSILQAKVRELMAAFMPDVEWQYSGLVRAKLASGLETVQLTAMARVKESAASHLEERAQQAQIQSDGCSFNISDIQTDTSFPTSLVDEVESRLRISLLTRAREECDVINKSLTAKATERHYHVTRIEYQNSGQQYANAASVRNFSAGSAAKSAYGSGFDDEGALGNTQKMQMVANITLAR